MFPLLCVNTSETIIIRCMRHAAIYGQPWPCRTVPHGTGFLPTPHEDAPPKESTSSKYVTKKTLSAVDRKLAATASSSTKHRKREDDSTERPTKKRKIEVEVDTQVQKASPKGKNTEKKRHSLPAPHVGEKRKRGRPRLSSPRRVIKVEDKPDSPKLFPQPRNTNGRFEKKIRAGKKARSSTSDPLIVPSRAERAIEREKVKGPHDGKELAGKTVGAWISPRRKRLSDGSVDSQPRKKAHWREGLDDDLEPLKKLLPRPVSNFRGGKLFSNPNPLSFALKAWAGPVNLDESEDEKPPVTPPDNDMLHHPNIIEADSVSGLSLLAPSPVPLGALTVKPSPFNFAKRRWVSTSASCIDSKTKPDLPGRNVEILPVEDEQSSLDGEFVAFDHSPNSRRRHSFSPSFTLKSQLGLVYSSREKVCAVFLVTMLLF